MKFVLVNGRIPLRTTFCLQCCEKISGSYLRELRMRLPYCAMHAIADSKPGQWARATPALRSRPLTPEFLSARALMTLEGGDSQPVDRNRVAAALTVAWKCRTSPRAASGVRAPRPPHRPALSSMTSRSCPSAAT